jgi:molybdopterin-binding protein
MNFLGSKILVMALIVPCSTGRVKKTFGYRIGSRDTEEMAISARNQLEGKVQEVILGDIMAHVVVKVGKNQIESVITRRSAEQLKLKKGDRITVVIKSTEVMLQKD